jgi:hypothetical protein
MRPTEFSKNKTKRNRNKKVGGDGNGRNNRDPKSDPKPEPTDQEILVAEVDNFFKAHNGNNSDGTINYNPITYETFKDKNSNTQEEDNLKKFKEITGNETDTTTPITRELFENYIKNKIKFRNMLIKLFVNLTSTKLITSIKGINKKELQNKFLNFSNFKYYFGIPDDKYLNEKFIHISQIKKKDELENIYKLINDNKNSLIFFKDFMTKIMNSPSYINTIKKYDINTQIYEDEEEESTRVPKSDFINSNPQIVRGGKNKSKKQIRKRKSNKKKSNRRR